MRIVTLPPGATDLVESLGLASEVVGRTGDPASAPALAREADPPEPDRPLIACVAPHAHVSRYVVDTLALAAARPEVILTEEVCPVCRALYRDLADGVAVAGAGLGGRDVPLLTFNPRRLEDVLAPIVPVATLLGRTERGERLLHARSARLLALSMHVARHLVRTGGQRPTVALIRAGGDRLVAPGRWIPDLLDAAGGVPLLVEAGEDDVPVTAEDVGRAHPEVLIVGADGPAWADRGAATVAALTLPGTRVWALRYDGLFTRPGPHLVEGVEVLLRMISPAALGANGTPPPPDRARPTPAPPGPARPRSEVRGPTSPSAPPPGPPPPTV
jgi:iron complex transport system substrate-binding protein